jgi:hypothetical protein
VINRKIEGKKAQEKSIKNSIFYFDCVDLKVIYVAFNASFIIWKGATKTKRNIFIMKETLLECFHHFYDVGRCMRQKC